MSALDSFAGNAAFRLAAARVLEAGRAHAVLICGAPGCGAGYAARLMACDWLGNNPALVLSEQHPDCITLRGSGKSGGIPVKELRAALLELHSASALGDRRALIISGAQDLGAAAASALLKTLESPPRGVLFLLTAPFAGALFDTVVSRCETLSVLEVTAQECRRELMARCPGCGEKELEFAVSMCGGRIGPALQALKDGERLAALERAARALDAFEKGDKLASLMALNVDRDTLKALIADCVLALSAQNREPDKARLAGKLTELGDDIAKYINPAAAAARFCASLTR